MNRRMGRGAIRAIVLDAQPLWRRTLTTMLAHAGVCVVDVCSSAEQLEESLLHRPQLVVADPEGAGDVGTALYELRRLLPGLTTIVVSSECEHELQLAVPVATVISKQLELEAIEHELRRAIVSELEWARLTSRELEVLELVAAGKSNRDVARELWLSDQTVKFHLTNVYRKLGVGSRHDAVALAQRQGLLNGAMAGREDDEDLVPAAAV